MGLHLESDGRTTLTGSANSLSTTAEHVMNKVLSFALIRLTCKLVDFIAPAADSELPQRVEAFVELEDRFDEWRQMLSISFHPDGTFYDDEATHQSPGLFGREIWFSNDFCSVTMLYYHMSRMLLLIHRPSALLPAGQQSSFDLLQTFRDLERKLQYNAAEVIAIVRGTPCDAVKLRSIQPLYLAGRCCSTKEDRKKLVGMLDEIQDQLGIATGYRINALLREWRATHADFGLQDRPTEEDLEPISR